MLLTWKEGVPAPPQTHTHTHPTHLPHTWTFWTKWLNLTIFSVSHQQTKYLSIQSCAPLLLAAGSVFFLLHDSILFFFFPDYLRCSHNNVAGAYSGGECVNASYNQASCGFVTDTGTSTQWEGDGGVGQWIKIKFIREYLINTIRVMQKAEVSDQSKGLRLEFSDGSEAFVSNASV